MKTIRITMDPPPKDAEYRATLIYLQKRYGERRGKFIANRLARAIRKTGIDPCMDNFRFADAADPAEMARYEEQRRDGCCGSVDERVTYHPTGQTFLFGFNYGH